MVAKKKPRLTPLPRKALAPEEPSPAGPAADAPPAGPDLSHIADGLRHMAFPLADLAFMTGNAVVHPPKQIAEIRASLQQFQQVEPLIVNRRPSPPIVIGGNGRLSALLADNHTHAAVLFVDLDEARANALSLSLNATAEGREWSQQAIEDLLLNVDTGHDAQLDAMLAELVAGDPEEEPAEVKPLAVQKPPVMAWVLLGIPTVRFGEIAETVERLAAVDGVLIEMALNNGEDKNED